MRKSILIEDLNKTDLFNWIGSLNDNIPICLLNSNDFENEFELLIGIDSLAELVVKDKDSFNSLKEFYESQNDWLMGYLTYDLKNEIENIESKNIDQLNFPPIYFFRPKYIFRLKSSKWEILIDDSITLKEELASIISQIKNNTSHTKKIKDSHFIKSRLSKINYIEIVDKLKSHIKKGDIYEINFCQEFYSESAKINPFDVYEKLNSISPAPFSCYFKNKNHHLMCSSPERFLKKTANTIISQPIKGTIKRGKNEEEDQQLKKELFENQKERSENIMIVDLVRNDLSKSAQRKSVNVDELFGIYTFKHVHQMISTVSSKLREDIHFTEAIKNAFPMGSMTGAPKLRAMELIEENESTKRNLFSGSVGYIDPEENFDFNVVIRSIFYNSVNDYLSFSVGSAITINCNAENEYDECLLKARAMFESLNLNK